MRRTALLGLILLLPGCHYAGNPFDGFPGFIADTHTYHLNPNAPPAVSENERLVRGEDVQIEPLLPEAGNIWPGPPAPIPTLQDVQKLNNLELLPGPSIPQAPPGAVFPQNAPAASPPGPAPSSSAK
jgi:hypothetical protein